MPDAWYRFTPAVMVAPRHTAATVSYPVKNEEMVHVHAPLISDDCLLLTAPVLSLMVSELDRVTVRTTILFASGKPCVSLTATHTVHLADPSAETWYGEKIIKEAVAPKVLAVMVWTWVHAWIPCL